MTKIINSILSKHGVTLGKKKPVTKKSTQPNPINVGGKQGEDLAENDIIRSGLSFRRQPKVDVPAQFFEEKRKTFDFSINHNGEQIYIEAKYQRVDGSVKDKIAGLIWGLSFIDKKVVVVLNGQAFKDKYVKVMVNRIQSDEHLNERIKVVKGSDFYSYLTTLNN